MSQRLLQKGDVIRLENGMKVYADIQSKFKYVNRPFSKEITHTDITIGKILTKRESSYDELKEQVLKIFECQGLPDSAKEKISPFIESLNLNTSEETFDTSLFAGEYTVINVLCNGGGTQRTPCGYETYPDGHHVFCQKNDDPSIMVDFYQTGAFTAMIPDIEPIH